MRESRECIRSIRTIRKLAGMGLEHVVDADIYLMNIGQIERINAVFPQESSCPDHSPGDPA